MKEKLFSKYTLYNLGHNTTWRFYI